MIIKTTLDMLDKNSVSVKKQKYSKIDGVEYAIGQPHRRAYVNSERGRQEVENELEEQYKKAIFSIWGDEPTVDDTVT